MMGAAAEGPAEAQAQAHTAGPPTATHAAEVAAGEGAASGVAGAEGPQAGDDAAEGADAAAGAEHGRALAGSPGPEPGGPEAHISTQAWLERYERHTKAHNHAQRNKQPNTWRPYVLKEALLKAAQDLPEKTKFGDQVVSKILMLTRWKNRARQAANSRGFSMAARRPWLRRFRELTQRYGNIIGAALEHNGVAPHVEYMMQNSHAILDERIALSAEQLEQSRPTVRDIRRRMKCAMRGVQLWGSSGDRVVVGSDGDEDEYDSESEGAGAEGAEQAAPGSEGGGGPTPPQRLNGSSGPPAARPRSRPASADTAAAIAAAVAVIAPWPAEAAAAAATDSGGAAAEAAAVAATDGGGAAAEAAAAARSPAAPPAPITTPAVAEAAEERQQAPAATDAGGGHHTPPPHHPATHRTQPHPEPQAAPVPPSLPSLPPPPSPSRHPAGSPRPHPAPSAGHSAPTMPPPQSPHPSPSRSSAPAHHRLSATKLAGGAEARAHDPLHPAVQQAGGERRSTLLFPPPEHPPATPPHGARPLLADVAPSLGGLDACRTAPYAAAPASPHAAARTSRRTLPVGGPGGPDILSPAASVAGTGAAPPPAWGGEAAGPAHHAPGPATPLHLRRGAGPGGGLQSPRAGSLYDSLQAGAALGSPRGGLSGPGSVGLAVVEVGLFGGSAGPPSLAGGAARARWPDPLASPRGADRGAAAAGLGRAGSGGREGGLVEGGSGVGHAGGAAPGEELRSPRRLPLTGLSNPRAQPPQQQLQQLQLLQQQQQELLQQHQLQQQYLQWQQQQWQQQQQLQQQQRHEVEPQLLQQQQQPHPHQQQQPQPQFGAAAAAVLGHDSVSPPAPAPATTPVHARTPSPAHVHAPPPPPPQPQPHAAAAAAGPASARGLGLGGGGGRSIVVRSRSYTLAASPPPQPAPHFIASRPAGALSPGLPLSEPGVEVPKKLAITDLSLNFNAPPPPAHARSMRRASQPQPPALPQHSHGQALQGPPFPARAAPQQQQQQQQHYQPQHHHASNARFLRSPSPGPWVGGGGGPPAAAPWVPPRMSTGGMTAPASPAQGPLSLPPAFTAAHQLHQGAGSGAGRLGGLASPAQGPRSQLDSPTSRPPRQLGTNVSFGGGSPALQPPAAPLSWHPGLADLADLASPAPPAPASPARSVAMHPTPPSPLARHQPQPQHPPHPQQQQRLPELQPLQPQPRASARGPAARPPALGTAAEAAHAQGPSAPGPHRLAPAAPPAEEAASLVRLPQLSLPAAGHPVLRSQQSGVHFHHLQLGEEDHGPPGRAAALMSGLVQAWDVAGGAHAGGGGGAEPPQQQHHQHPYHRQHSQPQQQHPHRQQVVDEPSAAAAPVSAEGGAAGLQGTGLDAAGSSPGRVRKSNTASGLLQAHQQPLGADAAAPAFPRSSLSFGDQPHTEAALAAAPQPAGAELLQQQPQQSDPGTQQQPSAVGRPAGAGVGMRVSSFGGAAGGSGGGPRAAVPVQAPQLAADGGVAAAVQGVVVVPLLLPEPLNGAAGTVAAASERQRRPKGGGGFRHAASFSGAARRA